MNDTGRRVPDMLTSVAGRIGPGRDTGAGAVEGWCANVLLQNIPASEPQDFGAGGGHFTTTFFPPPKHVRKLGPRKGRHLPKDPSE